MRELLNHIENKKIIISFNNESWEKTEISFLNFDIANFFQHLFEKAYAVNFFGGTMQPLDDFKQLFSSLSIPFKFFRYDHVIDPEHYTVLSLRNKGLSKFEFTYKNLQSDSLITQSLLFLEKICREIPRGIVLFFASYSMLGKFKSKFFFLNNPNLFSNKKLFFDGNKSKISFNPSSLRETQETDLLRAYENYLKANPKHSAVLWSVMGGVLSEGINFKDFLARGVICVGVPFPNLKSPKIDQKIQKIKSIIYFHLLTKCIFDYPSLYTMDFYSCVFSNSKQLDTQKYRISLKIRP